MPFDCKPLTAPSLTIRQAPPGGSDSLDAYLQAIKVYQLLNREDEFRLARALRAGDRSAAQTLALSNLRFVVWASRRYKGYGLPLADLIQQGNVGLLRAIKRFDPAQGVRLMSFAVHSIRAEMHDYILRNWRVVRRATTKTQLKLFFNRGRIDQTLAETDDPAAAIQKLAAELGVNAHDVGATEERFATPDVSFDASPPGSGGTWADRIIAPDADPALKVEDEDWQQRMHAQLSSALRRLDVRSRDIVKARFLGENGAEHLASLAGRYGISPERVRQIQNLALAQLRGALSTS